MFESRLRILTVCLGLLVVLVLGPQVLAATPVEPAQAERAMLALPPAQDESGALYMYNSYEWSATTGPVRCPDPPIFKAGTRVVYSYIPALLTQDLPTVVLWYELDAEGNPIGEEPIATGQAVLAANSIPNASLSFGKGVSGLFGAYMFVQDENQEWVLLAETYYGIATALGKVPEPGACPLPEPQTGNTGGGGGGSGTETAQAPLKISWSDKMTYEGRMGESRWCQVGMTYQNNSGQTYNWPDYRPGFLILNGDDSMDGWYYANYYAKEDGWENGISGTPPPIPSGSSADWTWYSATSRAGQYCAAVAVTYGDWVFGASYDQQGNLVGAEVYPPEK